MLTDEFVNECLRTAADLGLYFAGEPDDRVANVLERLRAHIDMT